MHVMSVCLDPVPLLLPAFVALFTFPDEFRMHLTQQALLFDLLFRAVIFGDPVPLLPAAHCRPVPFSLNIFTGLLKGQAILHLLCCRPAVLSNSVPILPPAL